MFELQKRIKLRSTSALGLAMLYYAVWLVIYSHVDFLLTLGSDLSG